MSIQSIEVNGLRLTIPENHEIVRGVGLNTQVVSLEQLANEIRSRMHHFSVEPLRPQYRLFRCPDGYIVTVTRNYPKHSKDIPAHFDKRQAAGDGRWITEWQLLPAAEHEVLF